MTNNSSKSARYRFGSFSLDPEEGSLSRNGIRIKLQDLPFRLLVMLVERPGEVITREEVRQRLWPENTFVEFDNSLGVAIRKVREALSDSAETPNYVATVPRRGYRFVATVVFEPAAAGALATDPALAETPLEPVLAPASSVSPPPASSTHQPHWGVWAGAALALVIGVVAVSFRFHTRPPYFSASADSSVTAGVRLRRSVAILGFRNLPGRPEDDWLSPVFTEMLDTELGTRGDLRMISGEDVARAKRDLPATETATLSKATLDRLHANPGADVVILGSYTPLPGKDANRIRLDLRVQDTADGETIAEEAIIGDRDDLFGLAAKAGDRLRQRLGLNPNSSGDASAARLALPADQESARLYVAGREKLWAFDFLGARDVLEKAVAADPRFPLGHSALSEAWWHLGYNNNARAEAQRARELSNDLGQEDRWLIEGQYWRSMNNWTRAVQAYQDLFHRFPDSLDYGLLLATAQLDAVDSQPSAALQTLAALRRLPPPAGDDARIDMTEASAWIGQDLVKARAAAHKAIDKGQAQDRPVLVARTYGFLCQEGTNLGVSTQEAISDCESARKYAVANGDRNAEAMMITDLAGIKLLHGDLAGAEQLLQTAVKEFREVGNPEGITVSMGNLASARLIEGDLVEAKKLLEASLVDYRAIEDKDGLALALNNLGDLCRENGELDAAEVRYHQARAAAEEVDSKSTMAFVMNGLGDVYKDRGDLSRARFSYENSLSLRNQIGEKQNAGETEVALARLAVEDGQPAGVEAALRQWKAQFHAENQADDEVTASTGLAEALVAQGKPADAQKELDSSQELAAKSQNLSVRLAYQVAKARVMMASGGAAQAKPLLDAVLNAARTHGLIGIELEAMLSEAQLGQGAAAKEQLASVERMAKVRGFGLVARKAAMARS